MAPNGNICYIDCYDDSDEHCPLGYEDARSIILHDRLYLVINQRHYDKELKTCKTRSITLQNSSFT